MKLPRRRFLRLAVGAVLPAISRTAMALAVRRGWCARSCLFSSMAELNHRHLHFQNTAHRRTWGISSA
jgi:hypothetical protein